MRGTRARPVAPVERGPVLQDRIGAVVAQLRTIRGIHLSTIGAVSRRAERPKPACPDRLPGTGE